MTYRKLKPCPWCGRPTKLINYGELYFVTCDDAVNGWLNCDRVAVVYYQSVEDAIKGWNENEVLRGEGYEKTNTTLHQLRGTKGRLSLQV